MTTFTTVEPAPELCARYRAEGWWSGETSRGRPQRVAAPDSGAPRQLGSGEIQVARGDPGAVHRFSSDAGRQGAQVGLADDGSSVTRPRRHVVDAIIVAVWALQACVATTLIAWRQAGENVIGILTAWRIPGIDR